MEEQADSYFHKLFEDEYYREHGTLKKNSFELDHESNHTTTATPKFLAMVTAKIMGIIAGKCSADMLLDTGSKLNIMTLDLQENLELPLDPSGANWVLRSVSRHPVHLVSLCRNVPIDVAQRGMRPISCWCHALIMHWT